jgi:outer membrane protein assembly complex protein YaeT
VLGCGCGESLAQSPPALWGRPVTKLRLQCDCNLKLQNFPGAVSQRIGEPLDPAKVSESLKRLYATGRFAELRAEGDPEGDGVSLTFVSRAQYFIGMVTADGSTGPVDARALATASRLHLGHPFSDEDLKAAHKRLSDLLVANGYYQSHITHEIERNPDTLEANVAFLIKAGPPARVSTVQFQDDSGFPPARLMKVAGWHPHMILTATRLEHGLYRLHQFYVAHGRLQVNISVQQRVYDAKTNTEKMMVKADGGPLLRVRVQGASISSSQLQSLLPMYHDGVTDDQALTLSEKLLEGHFQQKGYFSAAVKASRVPRESPQPHVEILFRVNLGPHGDFAGFGVKGNVAIPTAELVSAITTPAQGLLPPSPTFSQNLVEQKVSTLLALYQSRGYLDARITPAINDNFGNVSGRRYVTLGIEEGARTTVHALTLLGIDAATENKLWPSLVSKPSQPYSLEGAHADRDRILDYLADHGYTHAAASWRITPAKSAHQVDLEFQVVPGAQDHIQQIVVLGNDHVRRSLVNRELLIHDGEPINQDAVLESQRRLYDLGLFNQVQITPQDQPASDAGKTVLVGLEESRRWILGYGGGFEIQKLGSNEPQGQYKASPRLSLSLTRVDVGGRGQTFSMGGRLSNIDTGANMGYLIPRLFNRDDLSLRINGLVDRSRDVLTFIADRKEASVSIEKRFSASTLLIGEYSFQRVEALDIASKVSGLDAAVLGQPEPVGMFGGSFVEDHRDDPSDATRGTYTLVNAGVSWKGFGSLGDFLRFTGQNSSYYALGSYLVFARKTQFGLVSPYGALYSINVPADNGQPAHVVHTDLIPLPERFFMGGSETMRGFSINQAGPRDPVTGYPIGGNALFLNSFELRSSFAQRRLGVVLFEDSGNVYTSIRLMRLFKFQQSSPGDFNYTSNAVGIGLRYKTPVGPIRFDVGYNLNPPRYNVIPTINGVNTPEVQRLSNVQFFLSIGQSF